MEKKRGRKSRDTASLTCVTLLYLKNYVSKEPDDYSPGDSLAEHSELLQGLVGTKCGVLLYIQ